METSSAILIDEAYEFSAPRFYDFVNGESEEEVQNAELWFENERSHAPSPFMLRIKSDRSVELSSICDFGNSEKTLKAEDDQSLQPTNAASNAKEELAKPAQSNMSTKQITDLAVHQVSSVDKQQTCDVSCDAIDKENGSVLKERTADEKIPTTNDESAASRGVCTPKPDVVLGKGGPASSETKKKQTARKIASALKNPSALKSKMQSSHTKSAKPAGARRDASNLKSSVGTPNLVQENQAIKRQKLDGGKSRQILSIKPPNFPHKTRPGATVSGTNFCSSTTKTSKDGRKIYVREEPAPFVSMAEILRKFQSSTRDLSLPHNSLSQDVGNSSSNQGKQKMTLTRPKEPEFETAQRLRTLKVKSSEELEAEMMAKMPKFKARLLNKKILEAPTLPPLPKRVPQPPEFQEFHLETRERANKNSETSPVVSTESHQKPKFKAHYLTEPKTPVLQTSLRARPTKMKSTLEIEQEELEKIPKFKARPLNKKIFESKGELGIFNNSKKQVTIPQEFHFAIDERVPPPMRNVADLFDKLSLNSEPKHEKLIPRITKPNPFHLHTEERGAEKERKFITELVHKQLEEEEARIPKANPYPYTTDYPLIPPKPKAKECTKPDPFHLESLERHEEELRREMEERNKKETEEARMRMFKAQPVLKEDPIPLPEKERKPLTQIQEFNLQVEHRAGDRAEFDKKIKEKEMMYKRYRDEAEAEKQMEEEKALKQLRRTLVPHARPVPNFANPFVPQKSCKETTRAKSPKLRVLRRKERKLLLSGNDIQAASSAAAALMR